MIDQLIRATAFNKGIRAVGVITTNLTEEIRVKQKLSYLATVALGRTIAAGLLLASSMKTTSSRVNIRIKGSGPLSGLLVDAGRDGTVRGYVENPDIELPPNAYGKLDVAEAIGVGYLYVFRDVGYGYPYSSTVELVSGEIGDDIAHFLATSEQTPSALVVGVLVNQNGVEAAGGILLQVLPKVARDQSLVEKLESRVMALPEFTPALRAGQTLESILQQLLGDLGLEITPEPQMVRFHCGCSFPRVLNALKMFDIAELEDMIEKDNGAEATCHFCGEVYRADRDHLYQIIRDLQYQAQAPEVSLN